MKQKIIDNLKNIPGWKTKRKMVVFAVDDYGNVRATKKMAANTTGQSDNRFDRYDNLETREDLEMLYEVLASVQDKNGHAAIFTPYALSANMNFEAMEAENWESYIPELLPETYKKLSASDPKDYEGTWAMWQEGIKSGLMVPQYHGREHFNLHLISQLLVQKEPKLMLSLKNRALCNIGKFPEYPVGWTAAFAFWATKEIPALKEIVSSGIKDFEKVYGYKSTCFTPPAQQFPEDLEPVLQTLDIRSIDKAFYRPKHIGFGKYKKEFNRIGYNRKTNLVEIVRNVVFEPTNSNIDHVAKAMLQIEMAFKWNKPAIISSHRVNFSGLIDPKNRKKGLADLKKLVKEITLRWPEVEFLGMDQLVHAILKSKKSKTF